MKLQRSSARKWRPSDGRMYFSLDKLHKGYILIKCNSNGALLVRTGLITMGSGELPAACQLTAQATVELAGPMGKRRGCPNLTLVLQRRTT